MSLRLLAQLGGRLDDDGVAVAEVQRAAVQRADFGAEFLHMDQPLLRAHAIRAGAEVEGLLAGAHLHVAAHAGGEVDDDFLVLGADALHHLGVIFDLAGALAGRGFAHVAVHDGGAGAGRLQRGIGDLLRRHRNGRVLADGVARAGDGTGDDDFGLHGSPPDDGAEPRPARKSEHLTFSARSFSFSAMAQYDVAFLLVPRFSMIALYGALEPLRVANRFAGADTFSWRFVSADGQPVAASNDIPVSVSGGLADIGKPDMAVISASYEPEKGITRPMLSAREGAGPKARAAGGDRHRALPAGGGGAAR